MRGGGRSPKPSITGRKEYLPRKRFTNSLESVAGGHAESGFCASSPGFAGPGSVLLRSSAMAGTIPAAARAAAGAK